MLTTWHPLPQKRAIPTERQPLVGEVSANFCGLVGVAWSAQRIATTVFSACYTGGMANIA
jgi:hypothetical protein